MSARMRVRLGTSNGF
ncbi:hypothetical protein MTR67_003669 [Solanum verrucosum]|uniref:Uncharacterized protein n=1 Tax=Solanum verrucosum TaxID=315347 RepID=A0AAF0T9W3_SOLVR|nr:hypothetical protein MTR67_003669 [Solanum verrucosum]